LITTLTDNGFNVTLAHDASEEDRQNHGYIRLKLDGAVVIERAEVQHNRNYRERRTILIEMADAVIKAAADAVAPATELEAPATELETVVVDAVAAVSINADEGASCLLTAKPARALSSGEAGTAASL